MYAELMNSNKYLRLLNKYFIILPLLLTFFFLAGCEEEKQKPGAVVKKKQKIMSGSTELYASEEERITFNKNDSVLTVIHISEIKKNHFGIIDVMISGNKLEVIFDPSVLTIDSVKKIFSEFIVI
jgi:PBP1b-binding outer membrane lipoprotein LpoB